MSRDWPSEITSRSVLFVEGKDEVNFFEAFAEQLGLSDLFVGDVGGVTHFPQRFEAALLNSGFGEYVRSYAIVRDADNNAQSTFQSVQSLLRNKGQPCPDAEGVFTTGTPRVGIFIIPGNTQSGMLESLCLETVASHPIMKCVDTFMQCVADSTKDTATNQAAINSPPSNPHKARAKCFLSGIDRDFPSIGVAARAGVWNFNHSCMQKLRDFLMQLDS